MVNFRLKKKKKSSYNMSESLKRYAKQNNLTQKAKYCAIPGQEISRTTVANL